VREADNLPPYSADVKKSRSLNSPRPLWACMACNGCALPYLDKEHTVFMDRSAVFLFLVGMKDQSCRYMHDKSKRTAKTKVVSKILKRDE
jgi:hypothetical protein